MKKLVLFTLIGLCLLALPVRAQINLLQEFGVVGANGRHPYGALIISGTTLYGMTAEGSDSNQGAIFKIETDGTGFTLLHEFAGGADDGAIPIGSLLISNSTLYGMTELGGDYGFGTIFKIQSDGSGFTLLHEFAGTAVDGKYPMGSLILSGSTLYGMTRQGGDSDKGIIFKIETDGTGSSLLHKFVGGANDGALPYGDLTLSGNALYGMTRNGGSSDWGTLFKIQTDGIGFTLLHEFGLVSGDGLEPIGSLLLSGSTLYGTTESGGGNKGSGTIFKIETDGSGYTLLHEFARGGAEGESPRATLILSGETLYGMTGLGGDNKLGTIFKMGTAGTGFSLLHEFAGGATDGAIPFGSLLISNSTLYGMTCYGGDNDDGVIFSQAPSITVTSPNGSESWTVGTTQTITWTSTGSIDNVNINYSTNSNSDWTLVSGNTVNDGSYTWTVPNTPSASCLVQISDAANAAKLDTSNAVFTIVFLAETVSAPNTPTGPSSGTINGTFTFSTGGSISSLGHTVQYKFDWDDGSDSDWLDYGTRSASHSWAANGTYHIRAMARCFGHNDIESLWSEPQTIILYGYSTSGAYNSPAQYKVLPEVIWAAATGGGTWMSDVQVTDIMGGSQIAVYYNTASGRRGPFRLWDNSAGGALSSRKFGNLLETIDGLDSGVFTYYGTLGALEFITQDDNHKIHAAARTVNGNYAKTFTALSLHDDNTATFIRSMIIPNLTNNADYRSTCGFFNPDDEAVMIEIKFFNQSIQQVGSTITRTLAGHGFTSMNPFTEAGIPYPGTEEDNIILQVTPYSGSGRVVCFGASANNASNDPAAHIAMQGGSLSDKGPGPLQVLPEAIWAQATGGGTWVSEVQIVNMSQNSQVSVYFNHGGGLRRGPFILWTESTGGGMVKYSNILEIIDGLDTGDFIYYGKVGALEFQTQDNLHKIFVTARTLNGNYSKTFPGLKLVDAETADTSRVMLIQNFTNNSAYRSTCGFYNPTGDAVTVEFTLLDASGAEIGTPFSKTFVGYDFQAFLPFNEAGVPYPANSFDNVILRVRPTSGTGQVICFGASANNASNDPAAHLAVQGQ